jgi:hypothetical protein
VLPPWRVLPPCTPPIKGGELRVEGRGNVSAFLDLDALRCSKLPLPAVGEGWGEGDDL